MWSEPFLLFTSPSLPGSGTTVYIAPDMRCRSLIPKRHANQPISQRILHPHANCSSMSQRGLGGKQARLLLTGKCPSGPLASEPTYVQAVSGELGGKKAVWDWLA